MERQRIMRDRRQNTQNQTDLALLDIPDFMSDDEAEMILRERDKEVEIDIRCATFANISCAGPGGGEFCACCQPV